MQRILTQSSVLGLLGVISTFSLLWFARAVLELSGGMLQTLIFLKLLVAGHFTIYLARNPGWFWERPWPSWKLIAAAETTQVLGTLAAVYGWLIPPIGWGYALGVWGYAIVWALLNNFIKLEAWKVIGGGGGRQARHVGRLMQPLHPRASGA
jgi:H+-transporting ATPase